MTRRTVYKNHNSAFFRYSPLIDFLWLSLRVSCIDSIDYVQEPKLYLVPFLNYYPLIDFIESCEFKRYSRLIDFSALLANDITCCPCVQKPSSQREIKHWIEKLTMSAELKTHNTSLVISRAIPNTLVLLSFTIKRFFICESCANTLLITVKQKQTY